MNKFALGLGILLLAAGAASGQWEPDMRLTENDSASTVSEYVGRSLAVDGEHVHVVWLDDEGPGYYPQTWYIRSTDQGLSWGEPTLVCSDTFYNDDASVAASDGHVHVFWSDVRDGDGSEVYYSRSTDSGATWSANRRLTSATGVSSEPNVALEGDFIHLVWEDSRGPESRIYYKRSPDRGFSWTQDFAISTSDSGAYHPTVAVADSIVQAVYAGLIAGGPEVHYVRSLDNGLTWEPTQVLTNSSAANGHVLPHIAASGPTVHITYKDRSSGNDEAFYLRSPDYGLSWGPEVSMFSTPGEDVGRTSLAASGHNAHVATHLRINSRNWIYYRHSTDGGLTWVREEQLSDSGFSRLPSISAGGTAVHVVWEDGRDWNSEVYYKRNPTGNAAIEENQQPTASSLPPAATVVRGVLVLGAGDRRRETVDRAELLDADGRRVMELHAGANDVSDLAPGVYFVRSEPGTVLDASSATKVVIQR